MPTTERLYQFDPKATLDTDDIIFCGNTSDASKEVQTTVAGLIGAYRGLLSIGELETTANQIIYTTASNTYAVSGVSAFGLLALNITGAASKIMVTDGSGAPGLSSTLPAFLLGGTLSTNGQIITNSLADGDVIVNTNGTGSWLLNSSTGVSSVIDDDSMATASATSLPTSESVKAYVDSTASGLVDSVTGTVSQINVGGTAADPILSLSSTINAPGTFTVQGTTAVNAIINDGSMATATAANLATATSIKTYVDNVAGGGFTVVLTCLLGTTANLTSTYDNGASGVGATLTNSSTQVALTIDSVLTQVNDRILVKDQSSAANNGVYCLDEETEILTQDGFKHYTQVKDGDLVLTFNCLTEKNEWQPATSINVFDVADQEMLSMYGQKGHRSISTLNHRWPVKHRNSGEIRIVESKDLNHSHSILKSAELGHYPEVKTYDDEFVQLVAWIYTEGEVRKNSSGSYSDGIRIAQSSIANPLYVSEIRDCLTHCFGEASDTLKKQRYGDHQEEWREDLRKNGEMTYFSLNVKAGAHILKVITKEDKIISKEFLNVLTRNQLELFLKTSLNADGHTSDKGQLTFSQKVKERAEIFQYACILRGYPANLKLEKNGQWCVYLGTRSKCQPHLSATHVKYTGKVWCPTTQNSTWIARKDGYVFITGNTITTVGDGSTNWVLTRATDYDEAAEIIAGTLVPVSSGTVNGGSIYLQSATVTTVGTDPVIFDIFAQPGNTFVTLATTQTISGAKTFSSEVLASNLSLNGNTLSSTDTDGNLNLTPNGAGIVAINNLGLVGNTLSSTNTNGDLNLTPNGVGNLVLDAVKWPQADGTADQVLSTDGAGQTVWVDASGGASVATQIQMEAASSSAVFSAPSVQQYHPSAAKAWVQFNGSGTVAIRTSYNVSSITDNGVGDYTVNFTNAFSSIDYCAVATCGPGTSVNYPGETASYATGPQATPTVSAWRFGTGQGAVSASAGLRTDAVYISVSFSGELA